MFELKKKIDSLINVFNIDDFGILCVKAHE